MTGFPGGTALSRIRVYDWPGADGLPGGTPHLHTASTEGYVVLAGHGTLETLSGDGYQEHPLRPETVLWFTPGTVHRLVNAGGLELLVLMSNAGLPEAGDAVLTFPPEVLADPVAYDAAATLPATATASATATAAATATAGATATAAATAAAATRRRDLAVRGYLALREQVRAGGPGALDPLYQAAAALVRERVPEWREWWRGGPLARAVDTGDHLDLLGAGHSSHLATSAVHTAAPAATRWGMCGHLTGWRITG